MINQTCKNGLRLLSALLVLILPDGTLNAQVGSAGYTDSLGSYEWFDETNATSFLDSSGQEWFKITENNELWEEAVTIRRANILGLVLLGFDSVRVSKDVFLYDETSSLFTKLSRLKHQSEYTQHWKPALNSETLQRDSKKSNRLKSNRGKTDLVLKFYPQKANIKNVDAIGLSKKGFFKHGFEASLEIFELLIKKISCNKKPHSDPIFDMHLRNSKKLLNALNQI